MRTSLNVFARRSVFLGSLCVALVGCGDSGSGPVSGIDAGPNFEDVDFKAQLTGRVSAPEMPIWGMFIFNSETDDPVPSVEALETMMGETIETHADFTENGVAPSGYDADPFYFASKLAGATVSVTATPGSAALGGVEASEAGDFSIPNAVPLSDSPYYFTSTGGEFIPVDLGMEFTYPATALPTATLRPAYARTSLCMFLNAYGLTDLGVAGALANHLNVPIAKLFDGVSYGGVAFFIGYQPANLWNEEEQFDRLPAFRTRVTSSAGTVYRMNVGFTMATPSTATDLGFYVDPSTTSHKIGITAIVLPASAAGTPITITPVDDGTMSVPVPGSTVEPPPMMTVPRGWIAPPQTVVLSRTHLNVGDIYFRLPGDEPPGSLKDPTACMIDAEGNY